MSEQGFLSNILKSPWISSDAISNAGSDQKNEPVMKQSPSLDQENHSTLAKISIIFHDLYNYYSSGRDQITQDRDEMIVAIKNSKQDQIGHDKATDKKEHIISNDLLSEIRSAGGTSKLNKVKIVRKEIKAQHDLTGVLSMALNARKGVIMDCQDEDNSEWDDI